MKGRDMKLVPVSEAKARLTGLVKASQEEDITLVRYGRPAAVLMSTERYNALMERLEDLEDSLAIAEAKGEESEPIEEVFPRLGLRAPQMA